MTEPPKPFRLFAVRDARVRARSTKRGRDVTDRIARRSIGGIPTVSARSAFVATRATHTLTLDLGTPGARDSPPG